MSTRSAVLHTAFAVIAAAALLTVTPARSAETLRFGHYSSTTDTPHMAAMKFKEIVESGSNGALEVSVHPAGELGNSKASLQGVRLGTIDITVTGNPYFTSFAPEMNATDLPFLFADEAHAYRVLDGEVGQELLDGLEKHGMKGLAMWEIGFRNVTNNVRAVHTPADMKGLKLRTTPNPAHVRAFEILGANPTPMPFSELYAALQTGTVDGQENPVVHIYNSRLHEVQKHLSLTKHAYTTSPLVMNLAKFNSLSAEHQELLLRAAHEAAELERRMNAELADESLEKMQAEGVQVVMEPDVDAFRALVADETRKMYADEHGTTLLEKIDALR